MTNSNHTKTISVNILGKEYLVACGEKEEHALIKSASYLDQKMREIRDSGKVIGTDRIAVIAALNIANDLLSGEERQNSDESFMIRIQHLKDKIEDALYKSRH